MRAICPATCFGLMLCLLGADAPTTALALKQTLTIDLGGGINMEFVLVKPGTFRMGLGSAGSQAPAHNVMISQQFYMGKFEVTQEQWQAVMGSNPSHFKGPKNPVDSASWLDCMSFVVKLSKKVPDRVFALPTEAQWEYACRAGTTTLYSFGNPISTRDHSNLKLDEYAWQGESTHPVGQKKPNPWGLYDMNGNVWEWCADWHAPYEPADAIDPVGPAQGQLKIMRGGGWKTAAGGLTSTYRAKEKPETHDTNIGVRLICATP